MLNNHLISIRKDYSFIFILFLLCSCAQTQSKKKHVKKLTEVFTKETCGGDVKNSEVRLLTTSAKYHSRKFKHCFKNYLRFEEDKSQTLYTCNTIRIHRTGRVNFAYARGYKGSVLPKDIKMCLEQDLWKMQFKGLQLESGHTIKFPLSFKSK